MGMSNGATFLTRSRPRGILTEADREYLRGERDLSRQATFERRKAIRERLHHSILDLHFLLEYFPDEDRDALVNSSHREQLDLGPATRGGIAFLWTFLPQLDNERMVVGAIDAALKRRGWMADVDVSIEMKDENRVEKDPEKAYWGRQGGILKESGGLVNRWKEEFEQRAQRPSPLSQDQVADAKARFDELSEAFLSGENLPPEEIDELASFLPEQNEYDIENGEGGSERQHEERDDDEVDEGEED